MNTPMKAIRRSARASTVVDAYIGNSIKARRLEMGVSQEQLAKKVGVTFQQMQKYENAANRVAASRLVDIAAALGANPADFFPSRK